MQFQYTLAFSVSSSIEINSNNFGVLQIMMRYMITQVPFEIHRNIISETSSKVLASFNIAAIKLTSIHSKIKIVEFLELNGRVFNDRCDITMPHLAKCF